MRRELCVPFLCTARGRRKCVLIPESSGFFSSLPLRPARMSKCSSALRRCCRFSRPSRPLFQAAGPSACFPKRAPAGRPAVECPDWDFVKGFAKSPAQLASAARLAYFPRASPALYAPPPSRLFSPSCESAPLFPPRTFFLLLYEREGQSASKNFACGRHIFHFCA